MEITDIVAIDGPAGAGKSTVARKAAEALGFAFLDTGAMYRAATWWTLHRGVDIDDPGAVALAVQEMPLEMREENGELKVLVDRRDVTQAIRSPEVTRQIFRLDQNPRVRERLVALQRAFGAKRPTVAEGRDIGTVVFPKAKCKVFLDASLEERTRRRAEQFRAQGVVMDQDALRNEIADRDRMARQRKESPLYRAEDAVLVDTTSMTLTEAVDTIVRLARKVF